MDKKQLINLTNELFRLFIIDITTAKQITVYRIAKDCNISKYFFYNKLKSNSLHYVSLPTIYIICNYYRFPFDILKYIEQLECSK